MSNRIPEGAPNLVTQESELATFSVECGYILTHVYIYMYIHLYLIAYGGLKKPWPPMQIHEKVNPKKAYDSNFRIIRRPVSFLENVPHI